MKYLFINSDRILELHICHARIVKFFPEKIFPASQVPKNLWLTSHNQELILTIFQTVKPDRIDQRNLHSL